MNDPGIQVVQIFVVQECERSPSMMVDTFIRTWMSRSKLSSCSCRRLYRCIRISSNILV